MILASLILLLGLSRLAASGTATNLSGLDFTGTTTNGSLVAGGGNDQNWIVTYASVGGTSYKGNSAYMGAPYVVNNALVQSVAWVQNTSSAQWITAPGAASAPTGGTTNTGGDYLPGNGTTGTNTAQYVYTLAFTIIGSGSGTVRNNVAISLTIAADDQYTVYVNPTLNSNGSVNTSKSTASASGLNAWTNTQAAYLQNYADGNSTADANFVIGTNTIAIVVQNTNSLTGSSSSTALNASGLLVYQVGNVALINGQPVPEVCTWLPVAGALGLFGGVAWRRRQNRSRPSTSPEPAPGCFGKL